MDEEEPENFYVAHTYEDGDAHDSGDNLSKDEETEVKEVVSTPKKQVLATDVAEAAKSGHISIDFDKSKEEQSEESSEESLDEGESSLQVKLLEPPKRVRTRSESGDEEQDTTSKHSETGTATSADGEEDAVESKQRYQADEPEHPTELRRSERERRKPSWLDPYVTYSMTSARPVSGRLQALTSLVECGVLNKIDPDMADRLLGVVMKQ